MNRELRDGLFMNSNIHITDEKKPGFPIQSRLIQLFVIIIGSWGFIGVLMECVSVPADNRKVQLAILLCAGLMYLLCLIPSYHLVKLFFGLLFYGLFLFDRLSALQNGFYVFENKVIERLAAYYGFAKFSYIADNTRAVADTTLLLIMVAIPMVTLLSVAVVRSHLAGITGVLLFFPIIVCLLFGLVPSEKYLIAYAATILYLSQSSHSVNPDTNPQQMLLLHRVNSKAAVILCLMSLLLFFLMKFIVSEKTYDSVTAIPDTKRQIQTALMNVSWGELSRDLKDFNLFSNQAAVGGLKGGELGKTGEVVYTGSEQLRITAPLSALSQGTYLKGYVGSVYTRKRWEGHSAQTQKLYKELLMKMSEKKFDPINQISQRIKSSGLASLRSDLELNEMVIEYEKANQNYLYAPYVTDYGFIDNINREQDLYAVPVKRQDRYTIGFYKPSYFYNLGQEDVETFVTMQRLFQYEDYLKNEVLYRGFVYQVYTELPKEGLERLKQEFGAVREANPSLGVQDKIAFIADYLKKNTSYTLSPGKLPAGKDYVEYFLYENKKGYCAHYASAATLMLRILGVPARYVEGYAVGPFDVANNTISRSLEDYNNQGSEAYLNTEVSVKDYSAHAWVEIYMDGIGWLPYDFTPSSDDRYAQVNPEPKEAVVKTPTTQPATPTPKETKGSSSVKQDKSNLKPLFITIILLLFTGTFLARAVYRFIGRRKSHYPVNRNQKALQEFARIEKILSISHGLGKKGARLEDCEEYVKKQCGHIDLEGFTACMEIVRKARFGKGRISTKELDTVKLFCSSLQNSVYRELPLHRILYLKISLSGMKFQS